VTVGVGSNVDAPITNGHYPPFQEANVFGQIYAIIKNNKKLINLQIYLVLTNAIVFPQYFKKITQFTKNGSTGKASFPRQEQLPFQNPSCPQSLAPNKL